MVFKSGLSSFVEKLNSESHGVFNFKLFTNTTKTDIRIADVNIKKPHIQKYLSGEDGNEKTTIIDSIFEEVDGGAHMYPEDQDSILKNQIINSINNLNTLSVETRRKKRNEKFLNITSDI